MKRKICLLLALFMLMTSVFSLASCKKDGEGDETTVSTTGNVEGDHDSKDDPTLYEDLPVGDYKGYKFRILNNISNYANTTIVPTTTSDNLSSAMYNRNAYIKDLLKIDMEEIRMQPGEAGTEINNLTRSGDFEYDIVYNEAQPQTVSAQGGAYYAVEDYEEYLKLSKPWWFTDAIKSLEIDERGFMLFSDMQLMYYDSIWAMTFNQQILSDNKQAFPYDLVREGEWTINALKELTLACAEEGLNAPYGVASHKDWILAMFSASDFTFVAQDEDEVLVRYEDNERFVDIYNTIMNSFFLSNGEERINYVVAEYNTESIVNDFPHYKEPGWSFQEVFTNGKAAFMGGTIGDIQMVRSAEFNYGIVPTPKYDKDQDQYVSWVFRAAASLGIPSTTPTAQLEQTCTIIENLAAYSYKLVKHEYYEIVVQTRTVRDNDSIEMLDVIFGHTENGTARFEIDSVYSIGISSIVKAEMSDRHTGIQSAIAGASEVKANIDKVIESYKG